jgi:hypothetical protein
MSNRALFRKTTIERAITTFAATVGIPLDKVRLEIARNGAVSVYCAKSDATGHPPAASPALEVGKEIVL